jgi:hypothetical protein
MEAHEITGRPSAPSVTHSVVSRSADPMMFEKRPRGSSYHRPADVPDDVSPFDSSTCVEHGVMGATDPKYAHL